jgi:hypothetical protein
MSLESGGTMKAFTRRSQGAAWNLVLAGALLALSPLAAVRAADEKEPEKPNPTPGLVEIRFADDSSLKMVLREEQIQIVTPYGKLSVPFKEVRQIEFATRIPPEVAKRVERAIADLTNADEKVRDSAVEELLKLKDRAYPALMEATKSMDRDLKGRAETVLSKLREEVPEGGTLYRKYDIVHTEEMKISGNIDVPAWKAKTAQFGDVEIKLVDLRGLRTPGLVDEPAEVLAVMPDPGNLVMYGNQIGKRFAFRVTGVLGNAIYGTEVYTSDSSLAQAAVHWGVLKPGQTGVVKVEIVMPPPNYVSTTRNGITSNPYGVYNAAYKILKK